MPSGIIMSNAGIRMNPPSAAGPALLSIIIADATPTQMTLTYSAALDAGSTPAVGSFEVLNDGVTKACTVVNVSGSTVVLTFDFSFYYQEAVLLFYDVPASNPVRASGAGPLVAAIDGAAVTNNIAATGTLYYVDPATGSDANAGTSQGSPWNTIPGTRNVGNTDYVSATYGGSSAALAAGSRVRVKAGSSFTSAEVGRLQVNSTWWASGTAKNPSVIQVADDWGSGVVTYDGTGMTEPGGGFGLVTLQNRNYIHLRGAGASARWVIRDAGDTGLLVYSSTGATHILGCNVAWVECTANTNWGADFAFADDFVCRDSLFHTNGANLGVGLIVGFASDNTCIDGEFRDCEMYDNAPTWDQLTFEGLPHGAQITGANNLVMRRCKAYGNARDGFDQGSSTNTNPCSVTYIDCDAWDNGEDNFGCNGCTITSGSTVTATFINCRSYVSVQYGWTCYDGVVANLYHCTLYGNVRNFQWFGDGSIDFNGPTMTLKNCYFGRCNDQVWIYTGSGGSPEATLTSDYNAWIATTALTDADFSELATPNAGANYNDWSHFGANETVAGGYRTTTQQAFVNAAGGNFNLSDNTGTCANRGTALSGLPAACERDGSSTRTTRGRLRNTATPDLGAYEYA